MRAANLQLPGCAEEWGALQQGDRVTDFHWLVLRTSVNVFCELHNDGALGSDGRIGPYVVDRIDFEAVVERFFFDTDFLFGPELRVAMERGTVLPDVTPQTLKIAARVKPDEADLALVPIEPSASMAQRNEFVVPPGSGYIGPYPMRERSPGC